MKRALRLPFALLSDSDSRVIRLYGVFHEGEPEGRPIARPATFIIDAVGVIRARYVGDSPTDRPTIDAVLEALQDIGNADLA